MGHIGLIVGMVVVLTALGIVWWYYPSIRKGWAPTTEVIERTRKTFEDSGAEYPPEKPRIVVSKADRTLKLYDGDKLVKTYRVGLGTSPVDDKRKEGDGCTPEGKFYVCTRNEKSRFHLFLGLSYPNKEDAERGLKSKLISQAEHDAIVEAIDAGKRPPWNTRLGGEVGIHGNGSGSDWTLGCIALDNADIEEVFMASDIGTPIEVLAE